MSKDLAEIEAGSLGPLRLHRRPPIQRAVSAELVPLDVFQMDWQGQKLSETLMQAMLVAFAAAAFATGYALGSFQTMLLVYAGGVVLTTLVTVPNWPFYNRNPLKWLDPAEAERHPRPQQPQPAPAAGKKKPGKNHQK